MVDLVELVLFPSLELKTAVREFKVQRPNAEPLVYTDITSMRDDYENDVVWPTNAR